MSSTTTTGFRRIERHALRIPLLVPLLFACGSSGGGSSSVGGPDASQSAGGSAGTGGSSANGGSSARGGAPGGGGAAATGGTRAASGGRPSGGAPAAGGSGGAAVPDAATPPPSVACAPLAVTGTVVDVTTSTDLVSAVYGAAPGTTFLLADGTYALGGKILQLRADSVTLRGKSGNREAVVLDGEYSASSGEVLAVTGSHVTIADLTIAHAYTHAIHVQATDAADVVGTTIFDVHVLDALEQGIKINLNGATAHFPDDGTVGCSHIELTSAGRPQVRNNCYTGGIDAHGARGWRVHDNRIEGFWCAQGLSEHGVHFWTGSRDTVVERNQIRNCARGVGLGLGETTGSSSDAWRTYADKPCGNATPVGHYGGIVRNNFVFANDGGLFASASGFDSGIDLEQACGANILHNTIFAATPPLSSAVEWRFANTSATVVDNLANAPFKNRGNGATATVNGNVATATATLFVGASQGDFHLASPATGVRGAGVTVAPGLCDDDIDGDPRARRDVGADEMP